MTMDKIRPLKVDIKPVDVNITPIDFHINPLNITAQDLIPDVTLDPLKVEITALAIDGLKGDNRT